MQHYVQVKTTADLEAAGRQLAADKGMMFVMAAASEFAVIKSGFIMATERIVQSLLHQAGAPK